MTTLALFCLGWFLLGVLAALVVGAAFQRVHDEVAAVALNDLAFYYPQVMMDAVAGDPTATAVLKAYDTWRTTNEADDAYELGVLMSLWKDKQREYANE